MEVLFMEHLKHTITYPFFITLLIAGILFSGCISYYQQPHNQDSPSEMNASAVAIALNDSRMQLYLGYDGSYEITDVRPTSYEIDDSTHQIFNVTGVEIDSPTHLYHVYVNVTNGTVDSIWAQPKRGPEPPP
jgi:hypothetical protein